MRDFIGRNKCVGMTLKILDEALEHIDLNPLRRLKAGWVGLAGVVE